MIRRPPRSTLFPTRRSSDLSRIELEPKFQHLPKLQRGPRGGGSERDRKSTRLNSSHSQISYAVFCLKKKKITDRRVHQMNGDLCTFVTAGQPSCRPYDCM